MLKSERKETLILPSSKKMIPYSKKETPHFSLIKAKLTCKGPLTKTTNFSKMRNGSPMNTDKEKSKRRRDSLANSRTNRKYNKTEAFSNFLIN